METEEQPTTLPTDPTRGARLSWAWGVLIRPRRTFEAIIERTRGVWFLALLVLTAAVLAQVIASGIAQQGDQAMTLPPNFEDMSPEQQQQFMQAQQMSTGPLFDFVFPAILGTLGMWAGWVIIGGAYHLLLTLLGVRGSMIQRMNIAAWARMPLALRALVRATAVLVGGQAITATGLSGFVDPTAEGAALLVRAALALVDIYAIWQIVLLVVGARVGEPGVKRGRLAVGVTALMIALYGLQALVTYLPSSLARAAGGF
jgi:hypothetical protein